VELPIDCQFLSESHVLSFINEVQPTLDDNLKRWF